MSRRIVLPLAVLGAVLVIGTAAVLVYDHSRRDTVASGVRVAGIPIGGMGRESAIATLNERLLDGLRRPIRIDHASRLWTLSAREARIAVNVVASVDRAIEASRGGSALTRTWRSLTGGRVREDVVPEVSYSKDAVVRLLDRVRNSVEREPIDATVQFTAAGPRRIDGRPGLAINASDLHRQIRASIVSPSADRRFVVRTRKTEPKVTDDELEEQYATILYVDRSAFRLTLYKKLEKVKSYGIAVGQVGLETPAGRYTIQNKAINPAWHVPDSDWAGKLRGKVIPGGVPENPIKARWMGIYDGAGIHGTGNPESIGTNASHGCIRMRIPEVIELYDEVPVGAPIYIA